MLVTAGTTIVETMLVRGRGEDGVCTKSHKLLRGWYINKTLRVWARRMKDKGKKEPHPTRVRKTDERKQQHLEITYFSNGVSPSNWGLGQPNPFHKER